MSVLCFKWNYFLLTIGLFLIEVLIALFLHDKIIRPYIGDLLVVIFIYCFIRTFLNVKTIPAAIGVLLFAYIVETLQYFQLIQMIGLENNKVARVVIGTSFSWQDILAYTVGIILVIFIENKRHTTTNNIKASK